MLYSTYSYYKNWLYSLCCTIYPYSLFILYLVVCTSQSPTPILPLPPSLYPLIITSLFSISVCFFFVIFISLFDFLDSTYKWYPTVFIFLHLTYFTKHNTLQVYPCCCKWQNLILFYGWVVFHGIYIPYLLYPFITWWTLRLPPYLGCCK